MTLACYGALEIVGVIIINTLRAQYVENSWICYSATIANYYIVRLLCSEAVRSAILAIAIGVDPARVRVRGSGPSWNFASEGPPLFLKHGYETQWTQSLSHCCHQTRFWALNALKMRLRPGLCPWPRWGSLQRSPDPLAVFEAAAYTLIDWAWFYVCANTI